MKKRKIFTIALGVLVVVNVAFVGWLAFDQLPKYLDEDAGETIFTSKGNDEESEDTTSLGEKSFTFVGVGDNLIHGAIWYGQNAGAYDFTSIYENTNSYTQNADLAYINGETICAAENESELASYPVFNGPQEILDAVASAGFDWMSLSSNHSMDTGSEGIFYELNYLSQIAPDMSVTGSYLSEEDSNTPIVREVNGIKVGLTGYTYGLNGYSLPEDMPWLIEVYRKDDGSVDYDKIAQDLDALSAVSDVQIVSMHWGDEYVTEPTDEERELAAFLNEHGVEVIIGSHPHVVQTAEIYHGDEQDTLIYYSLGNFLSAQDNNENMVGGMASFTLNYDFDTQTTTFTDVKYIPTITWYSSDYMTFRTYALPEYTDELASSHLVSVRDGQDISRAWVAEYFSSIVGDPEGIEVVLE
jgi:poly-gamma-glutamate synthesis protein (capsule biosynthesis protein)